MYPAFKCAVRLAGSLEALHQLHRIVHRRGGKGSAFRVIGAEGLRIEIGNVVVIVPAVLGRIGTEEQPVFRDDGAGIKNKHGKRMGHFFYKANGSLRLIFAGCKRAVIRAGIRVFVAVTVDIFLFPLPVEVSVQVDTIRVLAQIERRTEYGLFPHVYIDLRQNRKSDLFQQYGPCLEDEAEGAHQKLRTGFTGVNGAGQTNSLFLITDFKTVNAVHGALAEFLHTDKRRELFAELFHFCNRTLVAPPDLAVAQFAGDGANLCQNAVNFLCDPVEVDMADLCVCVKIFTERVLIGKNAVKDQTDARIVHLLVFDVLGPEAGGVAAHAGAEVDFVGRPAVDLDRQIGLTAGVGPLHKVDTNLAVFYFCA